MKSWLIGLILLVVLFSVYVARIFSGGQTSVNFAESVEAFKTVGVPNFVLPLYDSGSQNRVFDFSAVKDKVIIINFWATWCEPCVREFPSLLNLAHRYKDTGKLSVVAISIDKEISVLPDFLMRYLKADSNFYIAVDFSGEIASKFGTKKIPESFIVDQNHRLIRKVISDQNWEGSDFLILLESWIKGANNV